MLKIFVNPTNWKDQRNFMCGILITTFKKWIFQRRNRDPAPIFLESTQLLRGVKERGKCAGKNLVV